MALTLAHPIDFRRLRKKCQPFRQRNDLAKPCQPPNPTPARLKPRKLPPAVQRSSGPEAEGEQSPQALWTHLRHELRTPLDAIIVYSELLLGDADGLGQADFIANLNLIHSAGRQLLEIINDLLDTNKFASGDVVFNLASLIANLHYKVRMPINDVISFSADPA